LPRGWQSGEQVMPVGSVSRVRRGWDMMAQVRAGLGPLEKVFKSPVGPDAPDADPGGATNSPGRDRSENHRRPRDRTRVFRFSGFQTPMKADTQISRSGVSYVHRLCENSKCCRIRGYLDPYPIGVRGLQRILRDLILITFFLY
jgi:hypothetical protein